jgi:hypothetical protein
MLSLWDIGSDIALCISIFQTVGLASWMPWISVFAIFFGLGCEAMMIVEQSFSMKGNKLTKKGLTDLDKTLHFFFFMILLLEDLPQITV